METQGELFPSYTYGEGSTGAGQAVRFTCRPGEVAKVKEFLAANVRTIDLPTTGRMNVQHGGYGQYTRYNITQHRYAGGSSESGWGYIEVLEIHNAPEGRCSIVINECSSHNGSVFTEWDSLDAALAAYEVNWRSPRTTAETLPQKRGFKRRVVCRELTPWFYAIGNELLIDDFAFPEGFQDDPVFRFGNRFVVYNEDGYPSIKTCMGARLFIQRATSYQGSSQSHRVVYWSDGSIWEESTNKSYLMPRYPPPRLIRDDELWITEAVEKFQQVLAGKLTEFTVDFTDGRKFVGKLVTPKGQRNCVEGDYNAAVHIRGEKSLKGWVKGFKPTPEHPDIVRYITSCYASQGRVVERLEILGSKTEKGGKKWCGVYYEPPRQ